MLRNKRRHSLFKRKIFILSAIVVLGVVAGLTAFIYSNNSDEDVSNTTKSGTVNYRPATPQEKQQSETRKDEIAGQLDKPVAPPTSEGGRLKVSPLFAGVSESEIRVYIPGIYEDNGTCTLVLTQGEARVTKNTQALSNGRTTNCAPFSLSSSDFSTKGEWNVIVNYNSATSQGSTNQEKITIQ